MELSRRVNLAPSFNPEEYKKLRQLWLDGISRPVGEDEYHCPACGNFGFRLHVRRDHEGLSATPCACQAIRQNWQNIRLSGMADLLQRFSFSNFYITAPWQKPMLEGAAAYAREPEGWILFGGQPGSGKTHLCSAICRSLVAQGKQILYMPWREKIVELKGLATDYEARKKLMDKLMKAPWLFIDDLFKSGREQGKVAVTKADLETAFELLNYRYNKALPTIISTELYPEELGQLDSALQGRILERCGKYVYTVKRSPDRDMRLTG